MSTIGVAIGYLATGENVQALAALVFNVMAIAGGLWWDVDGQGGTMASIAHLLPTYWANRLARSPFSGQGLTTEGALVLVTWTLGALAIATRRYRADLARSA